MHPYPISLATTAKDFTSRERERKGGEIEVYRCYVYIYIYVHICETWHDFAGKFARASVFPVGAETYFRKWRSACRFKGQWGQAATSFRSRT